MDILGELDLIDWDSIPAGYGKASDVHRLLLGLVNLDAGSSQSEVIDEISQELIHQGTVSPVADVALPFVVRIAKSLDSAVSGELLAIVANCAHPWSRFAPEGQVDVGSGDPARRAVEELLPVVAEIGDTQPARRAWAAACIGQFPDAADEHMERLRRWRDEAESSDEGAVYALALVCLGQATPELARQLEQQREKWEEDVTGDVGDEVLGDLLGERSGLARDHLETGELLWNAAEFLEGYTD